MRFSFIILHYQVYEDTIECVDSIFKNIKRNDYNIVIVDNKSPNNSGEILQTKYKNHSHVKVIELDKNVGFARGNNFGCDYAYHKFDPDFYIVINNDTIIEDNRFMEKIIDSYVETNFDLLGPRIWSIKDDADQNPVPYPTDSLKKSFKAFLYNISLFVLNFINKDTDLMKFVDKKRTRKEKQMNRSFDNDNKESLNEFKLHGAAIIFSQKYYYKYKSAFDPRTFMYWEEDILYSRVRIDDLTAVYNPKLKILHKEDSASTSVMSNNKLRRRFKFRHSIWSSFVLLKIYTYHMIDIIIAKVFPK